MVGVEGVPGAESPRGQRHAQAQPDALELEMVRGDREGEDAPAAQVQGQDHQGHGAEPTPFASGQLAAVRVRLDGLSGHCASASYTRAARNGSCS